MEDYLSKKYSNYSKISTQEPFTFEHISEKLLCSANMAKMYIKDILKKGYENLTFEQFSKVVCTAIDLD